MHDAFSLYVRRKVPKVHRLVQLYGLFEGGGSLFGCVYVKLERAVRWIDAIQI